MHITSLHTTRQAFSTMIEHWRNIIYLHTTILKASLYFKETFFDDIQISSAI